MSIEQVNAIVDGVFMLAVLAYVACSLRLSRRIVDRLGELERDVDELRESDADWWKGE